MADIKQAAKWIKEGKKVRHSDFCEGVWIFLYGATSIYVHNGYANKSNPPEYQYNFDVFDLLADDWEIA